MLIGFPFPVKRSSRFLNSEKLPEKLKEALSEDKAKCHSIIEDYFKRLSQITISYQDLKLIHEISGINEYAKLHFVSDTKLDKDVTSILKAFVQHGLVGGMHSIVQQLDKVNERSMAERSLNASLRTMCYSVLATYTDSSCPVTDLVARDLVDNYRYLLSCCIDALDHGKILSNEQQTRLCLFRNLSCTDAGLSWLSKCIDVYKVLPKFIFLKDVHVAEHFIELYPSESSSPPPEMDPILLRDGLTIASLRTLKNILGSTSNHVRSNIKVISLLLVTSEPVLEFYALIKPLVLCTSSKSHRFYIEMLVDVLARVFELDDARSLFLTWKRFIRKPIQKKKFPLPIVDYLHYHDKMFTAMMVFAMARSDRVGSIEALKFLTSFMKELNGVSYLVDRFGNCLLDLAHAILVKEDFFKESSIQRPFIEYLVIFSGLGISGELTIKEVFFNESLLEAAMMCKRWEQERKFTYKQLKHKASRAIKYLAKGNSQVDDSNYLEASRLYTKALAICPLSARHCQALMYRARAKCYMKMRNYYCVIHDCTRAVCLEPMLSDEPRFLRAQAHWKKKYYFRCWIDLLCTRDHFMKNPSRIYDRMFRETENILVKCSDTEFIK